MKITMLARRIFIQAYLTVPLIFLACMLPEPSALLAHEYMLEEVVVQGRRLNLTGEARSASEGVIGQEDLALRPLLRPGDVLESILLA